MRKHAPSGFTLIDLIVSIAIFGVITGAVVVNFNAGSRNDSVRQSSRIAEQVLRRAQTMTLAGERLSDDTFPAGGYGVRFDDTAPSTVVLFADIDGNFNYTGASEALESIALADEAVFGGSTLNVVFSAPDADVYFNGAASDASKTITFSAPSADASASVIIYRLSGQIRVQ